MAKLSFEEWKLRKEYEEYLKEEEPGEPVPKTEQVEEPAPVPKTEQVEEPTPVPKSVQDEVDYRKELMEIKKQMALMSKALSPSLNDINPVGIDDVVKKVFND